MTNRLRYNHETGRVEHTVQPEPLAAKKAARISQARKVDTVETRTVTVVRNGVAMEVETPTVESRYLGNYREPSSDLPGLVQTDDGLVYLVNPDGTRTQLAGGGSRPVNWCIVQFAPVTLTLGSHNHLYVEGDLTMQQQSGSDFSIGTNPGTPASGAIISAVGGQFQSAVYVGANQSSNAALDGGSTEQRYIEFLLQMGPSSDDDPTNPNIPVGNLGIDALVPILPNGASQIAVVANTVVSGPGYSRPGKVCCDNIAVVLVNGFGTDSVPVDSIYTLTVWQTG